MKRIFKVTECKSTSEDVFTLSSNRPFEIVCPTNGAVNTWMSDYDGEEHSILFYGMTKEEILKTEVTIINDEIFTKTLKEKKSYLGGLQHLKGVWIGNDFKAMYKSNLNEINQLLSEIEDMHFDCNENRECKKVYDIINYNK